MGQGPWWAASQSCLCFGEGGDGWLRQQCRWAKFLDREPPAQSLTHRPTLKKVLQVPRLHPGGPGAGRNRPHSSPELVVEVLFLQAHQRTWQLFGSCTLFHFLPPSGRCGAEGKDRTAWAMELWEHVIILPSILPDPSICPSTHLSSIRLSFQAARLWRKQNENSPVRSSGSGKTDVGGNPGSAPHWLWDSMQVTILEAQFPHPSCLSHRTIVVVDSTSNHFPHVYSFRHLWTTYCVPGTMLGAVWVSEGNIQVHDFNLLRTLRSTEGTWALGIILGELASHDRRGPRELTLWWEGTRDNHHINKINPRACQCSSNSQWYVSDGFPKADQERPGR